MSIAALFTIAKTWKQTKHYSAIKKNEIMPFFSNMDGPRDYHTK